jgi:hypothetical protein
MSVFKSETVTKAGHEAAQERRARKKLMREVEMTLLLVEEGVSKQTLKAAVRPALARVMAADVRGRYYT